METETHAKKWNPQHYKCRDCNAEIWSKYPGEFVACKCPKDSYIFVDQTEYYSRYGGDSTKFIEL